jgi:hypothetical protein
LSSCALHALQQVKQRPSSDVVSQAGAGAGRCFAPDVVLVPYEVAVAEMGTLRTVRWEAVVVDMRQK